MQGAVVLSFVYVFGGAVNTGSDSYVSYLLPGILLITIASGVSYTAFRLFNDMKSGIFERIQSLPIARSGALWAHVLTSLVANLISLVSVGVALLMGIRSGAGVLAWLAVAGSLILSTLALTWLAVISGRSAKSGEGADAFSYPLIFLPFLSPGIRAHRNDARPTHAAGPFQDRLSSGSGGAGRDRWRAGWCRNLAAFECPLWSRCDESILPHAEREERVLRRTTSEPLEYLASPQSHQQQQPPRRS
jgi:ABC-2 type transport system permease protein